MPATVAGPEAVNGTFMNCCHNVTEGEGKADGRQQLPFFQHLK